jgi:hypothetical protein
MKARVQLISGTAILIAGLLTADSFAQFGGMGGMSGRSRAGNRGDVNNQDKSIKRPTQQDNDTYEQIEYRLSLLEEDLHMQPEQRAAWESFDAKVRAYASDLTRANQRAATLSSSVNGGVDGVQYIEQAADSARNRAMALDDIAAATKTLYIGLKPDQKMLADVRIATIIAAQRRTGAAQTTGSDLPDLGSTVRTQR